MTTATRRSIGERALAALLGRVADGDEDAFARLYDATAPRIYGLALRFARDQDEAERVTRAAFQQVWRAAPAYEGTSAQAWLLEVVRDRIRTDLGRPALPGSRL